MTTTYQLPEGATSVAANGQTFDANEHGHIDVSGAFPGTVEALVAHAGVTPVKSAADLAADADAAAEKARFDAEVQAMLASLTHQAHASVVAKLAVVDQAQADASAAAEAELAELALREAAIAAAPLEQPEDAAAPAGEAPSGVIPPRRAKKA